MIITWLHAVRFVNLKMRSWLIGKYFDHIFNDNLRDLGSHKVVVLAYSQEWL